MAATFDMCDHVDFTQAGLGYLKLVARAIKRVSPMARPLSPQVAEKVIFTGTKATIATYELGTVRFGRREMRLKVLSSNEDLIRGADAAIVWLGVSCVFALYMTYELVRMIEEQRTMAAFMGLRENGADRTRKCRRAQRRLGRQAGHRRRDRRRDRRHIGNAIDPSRTRKLYVVRCGKGIIESSVRKQKCRCER